MHLSESKRKLSGLSIQSFGLKFIFNAIVVLSNQCESSSPYQNLTFTFTAFVRDDDSLRASAKLTIEVKKKELIARIKGKNIPGLSFECHLSRLTGTFCRLECPVFR